MGFNLPAPPEDNTFPQTAQDVANVVVGVLVAAFVVYALLEWRAGRGPLALVLLVGGSISYLNEPMLDVLGPLWHPRIGQDVAIETFGPAPLWGLGIYTVFFGGGTYVMYRLIDHGITRRQLWIGVACFWAVNLAVELPLLGAGLYTYYGYDTPPMMVGGLPLFWLVINAGAPIAAACLLLAVPKLFEGWKVIYAALVPMTVYGAYSMATGWPVFSATHAEDLAQVWRWGAACLTIAIGLVIINELGGWAEARAARRGSLPGEPDQLDGAGVAVHPANVP